MSGMVDISVIDEKKLNTASEENTHQYSIVEPTVKNRPVHAGMPELKLGERPVSFYEFWPSWLIYSPVALFWLYKSCRHLSLSLPACANPDFFLGGMVGESKQETFSLAGSYARKFIAPFIYAVNKTGLDCHQNAVRAIDTMKATGLNYPIIVKPDISCRGAGVRIIRKKKALEAYLKNFPKDAGFLLQKLIPYEAEAGIFYVRHPNQSKGKILSVGLKYSPYVYGNGRDSLKALIQKDRRAGVIAEKYFERHSKRLSEVLPEGQPFRLAFTGSHLRGAIFRDGNEFITEALTERVDQICRDIKGFHIGRLDIRFSNTDDLMQGKEFQILEVNGISGEATHIWDARGSLKSLYQTLFRQYSLLFEYGAFNRAKGVNPPGTKEIIKAWWREKSLTSRYPYSD